MVTNKKPNVTVIPSRYHAVSQEKDEGKNCGLLLIAVFPRTARNRRQAMRHKLNIIRNIYRKIPNGNWPGYLRMKVFPALTRENVGSLTI